VKSGLALDGLGGEVKQLWTEQISIDHTVRGHLTKRRPLAGSKNGLLFSSPVPQSDFVPVKWARHPLEGSHRILNARVSF
jgi:hypothetical protein